VVSERSTRVDVAVIGAGIVGCLVARAVLERRPGARVAVIDRDAPGTGASLRSVGLHFPRGASEPVRRMAAFSQDFYRDLLAADPGLPIYPVPMVVRSRRTERDLREVYLPDAELTLLASSPAGPDAQAGPGGHPAPGWTGRGAQYADVPALVSVLARDLRARAVLREGVAVTAVEPGPEQVDIVLGTGEQVRAGAVVLAPGPWTQAPAWAKLLAPLDLRIKKIVALHVRRPVAVGDAVVVYQDDDSFLLPVRHRGHWVYSYTSQEWDVDPDELPAGLTPSDLAAGLAALTEHAAGLVPDVVGGRVFCDAYSGDRQPVVRPVDDTGRVVFAGAACGSGYRLAPALATQAVGLLPT
jgi:glycine/D-amino acid oxidase-like deaminating enzyme